MSGILDERREWVSLRQIDLPDEIGPGEVVRAVVQVDNGARGPVRVTVEVDDEGGWTGPPVSRTIDVRGDAADPVPIEIAIRADSPATAPRFTITAVPVGGGEPLAVLGGRPPLVSESRGLPPWPVTA
jgi:hypothetical protein